MNEERETHPSWILVGASRVSGHRVLFQSDVDHQHFVRVTVRRATRTRDLHRDWVHGAASADLIEFDMSMAQWAEFLTTMNVGQGVPATLNWINGKAVEQEEAPERRIDLTAKEVRSKTSHALDPVNAAMVRVQEALDTNAGKRVLRDAVDSLKHAIGNLPANMAFAAKSLDEHAEKTVAHAKAEIDAMAIALERRAELAAAEAWGRYQAQGSLSVPLSPPMIEIGPDECSPTGIERPGVPRRHPDAPGECMECGGALDPQAIITECCMYCHSDQIRVYAEEDDV